MSQSIVTRWMMDSEMEVPRLPIFKEITAKKRSFLNAEAEPFVPNKRIAVYENRCVFSKEDDADYLQNNSAYDPNDRSM